MSKGELERTLEKIRQLVNQHEWIGALEVLDEAIGIDSECVDVWYQKGKILNRLGRIEEALEAFDRVIDINPEDIDGWYNRGVCLTKLGRNQESLEAFRESSRLNPDSSDQSLLGGVDFMGILGGDQSAIESFQNRITGIGEGAVYISEKYMYQIDLTFTWEDGTEEVMEIEEISPSNVQVRSVRFPQCLLIIEAKERIPCNYLAKELAGDLAAEIAANEDEIHYYVFPEGQVPAYSVRTQGESRDEVWLDIIVTDRFVYRLKRIVIPAKPNSVQFAESVSMSFRPISRD